MALVWADRVRETTTVTGTGAVTLLGRATAHQRFSEVLSTGDTAYGFIGHQTANEWEVSLFTMQANGTLVRTTTVASSNSGSAVNFSSGTKDVAIDVPAAVVASIFTGSFLTLGSVSYLPNERVLTAGSGISIVDGGAGTTATISASGSGTVTSVAMTVPGILSVSGSPVTTSGTLALSLATQAANLVFAGPAAGGAATPTFRSLVAADIPDLSSVYAPVASLDGYVALAPATTARNVITPTGTGVSNLTLDATSGHTAYLQLFTAFSDTTAQQLTAAINADFSVATHASRTGRLALYTYYTSTAQANITMTAGASGVLYGLTSIGGYISAPRQGTSNEVFGNLAGTALAGGSQQNTILGNSAGVTITTALGNTLVGFEAGNLTTGDYNVHIGHQARHSAASDSYGVAIGQGSRSSGNGVAIARQSHASGAGGISIGYLSSAGTECVSVGEVCITTNSSICIGYSQQNSAGNQCLIGNELSGDGTGSFCFGHKGADTFLSWLRDTSGVGSGTAKFIMRMTPTWAVSTEGSQLGKVTFGVSDAATERVGITLTAVTGGCTTTLSSALLGTNVANVTTTATNDDPNYQIRQNRVATTDATVTTLETIAITASKTYLIESRVVARRTGGAAGTADDGAVYIRRAMVTTKTGTVTINAVQDDLTQEDQAGWDCTFTVSGTNVLVRITGAADNNVTWHATTIIQDLGT